MRAKRVLFEGRGAGAATRLSGGRHARVSRARRIRRVTGRNERAGWNPRIEKGEEGSERVVRADLLACAAVRGLDVHERELIFDELFR